MKKIQKSLLAHLTSACILFSVFFSVFSSSGIALGIPGEPHSITVSVSFDFPLIQRQISGFDSVRIQDLGSIGEPGKPKLPMSGLTIPLPVNTKMNKIQITSDPIVLGSGYRIEPVEPLVTFAEGFYDYEFDFDETIYCSDELYPENPVLISGTYMFRGFDVCIATLYPLVYQPLSGTLLFYPQLDITIDLVADETPRPLFRGLAKDVAALEEKYLLTEASTFLNIKTPLPLTEDTYDLLILTTDELRSGFIPLANKHNATGIRTQVKTLTDVGGNTPELIREFINTTYVHDGIEYVLLGGDIELMPAKGLYAEAADKIEQQMPSDLYYACLDGDFDGNGNGVFGEPDDDVDLLAEVYVGRAAVSTLDEVHNFVSKTIYYIDAGLASGGHYINRVVLAGENLWNNPLTWGGDALDELVDESNNNGTITVGIPSDSFEIHRLYERDGFWSKSDMITQITSGVYIINHLGHGSITETFKLHINDVARLTNEKRFFVYSQACNSGRFDNPTQDCMAEYLTVKTRYGAFAAVMNTREGWYTQGSTDGPSHRYNRYFWHAIFNESITYPNMARFGVANQYSKEANLYRIDEAAMRWCYYGITFFGDPTLSMYKPAPQPVLSIGDISNGWGIQTLITNTGNANANLVVSTVQVTGGFFGLVNKTFQSDVGFLGINQDHDISTRPFLGLGKIQITITATVSNDVPVRKTFHMFMLGFYVLRLPDRLQQLFDK